MVDRQRLQNGQIATLKSSRRSVPVGQVVLDELETHLAAYATAGPLFVHELGQPLPYWR
ncbi:MULTISPECIES: hypothetical protein [unclassified Nocardioides]|uniref:hypothetical protein n=1 Tax=unclassified Nocardioides TaxID=2615069 RepID=UPI003014E33A